MGWWAESVVRKTVILTAGGAVAAIFTGPVIVAAQRPYAAPVASTPHCYLVAFERQAKQGTTTQPGAAGNLEVCVLGPPGSRTAITAIQQQLKATVESDSTASFVILNIMHLGEHYGTRNRTKISG